MGRGFELAALADALLESAGAATVPGGAFGAEGYLRLSYATDLGSIQRGLERIATVLESLPSARGAQMLLATQSPVVLGVVQPEHVLCFSKNAEGAISIVRGSEHPALLQWRGERNLGVLFADGVFG